MDEQFDVIVVGSGAGGLLAALRASELGLRTIVVEKAPRYGGTSAISGGFMWIPNNKLTNDSDSREKALEYLSAVCKGGYRADRLEAFVDNGPQMLRFLGRMGLHPEPFVYPDYFPEAPGALSSRAVVIREIKADELGDSFFSLREPPFVFKLFNRYSLDLAQSFALSVRPPGWRWVAAKMIAKYWLDVSWRRVTRRDRRLTLDNALVGSLRKALAQRQVPVLLNTRLVGLITKAERVAGVELNRHGKLLTLAARQGVVLAAGGFEQNQLLRDRYMPVATESKWSLTPKGGNTGEALLAALAVGAAVEFMDCAWWAPSMQLPSEDSANVDVTHQMFFDHRHPYSLCVNRLGKRFVNESCDYDAFGMAMIDDQKRTGANVPCWMIFDANYRNRYTAGGIMPTPVTPDRKIPKEYWDSYIYRADTLEALAAKIDIEAATLLDSIKRFNGYARSGVDPEFRRGATDYDRYFGDSRVTPNPCMGPVEKAPWYALRIDLGDLGTKGGLKADANARVLRPDGSSIEGLYAIGNTAGSPFGDCYPGAGGTLGPSTVFGYIAANDIAQRMRGGASKQADKGDSRVALQAV
jgi:3-oxosteroid 1-dehydrogenase